MKTTFITQRSIFFIFLFILFLNPTVTNAQWTQLGLDIDGEMSGDIFGASVNMNVVGDRIAIGAIRNNANGTYAGHVRIYEHNGLTWTQLGLDIDGEAANDLSGYSVSMNAAGNRIAIGAPMNGGSANTAGHVRIYDWNGLSWVQLGLDIDGEAANDESGWTVSMNSVGNRIAIGAHLNDGNGINAGHVRIYEWNGITWNQLGADIDGEAAWDRMGSSVSMNAAGDRIAIGAYANDGNGTDAGHVRIYDWNGLAWVQFGADIDGEVAGDESGYSVSMNALGNRLAIGAKFNSGNGPFAGHVRVYEWNATAWTQMGTDLDGKDSLVNCGNSVSINAAGNRVAIGAPSNDGNNNDAGHVQIYDWNGTTWVQLGSDIDGEGNGDYSGTSVTMNGAGDRVTIGATGNDGNGSNSGHVRVHEYNLPTELVEVNTNQGYLIYPNPASQNLILETQNTIGEVAQITSITGALILEFSITKETEKIDVSGFQNGIYFLRVGEVMKKVIVSK